MAGMRAIELVEHWLGRDEPRAFIEPATPIASHSLPFFFKVELHQRLPLGLLSQYKIGDLYRHGFRFPRRKRPGPMQIILLDSWWFIADRLGAYIVRQPDQAVFAGAQSFWRFANFILEGQRGVLSRLRNIGE